MSPRRDEAIGQEISDDDEDPIIIFGELSHQGVNFRPHCHDLFI
jgi:hypothetical protein